jgi:hypothetical protein
VLSRLPAPPSSRVVYLGVGWAAQPPRSYPLVLLVPRTSAFASFDTSARWVSLCLRVVRYVGGGSGLVGAGFPWPAVALGSYVVVVVHKVGVGLSGRCGGSYGHGWAFVVAGAFVITSAMGSHIVVAVRLAVVGSHGGVLGVPGRCRGAHGLGWAFLVTMVLAPLAMGSHVVFVVRIPVVGQSSSSSWFAYPVFDVVRMAGVELSSSSSQFAWP